jgi:hypothetical protein
LEEENAEQQQEHAGNVPEDAALFARKVGRQVVRHAIGLVALLLTPHARSRLESNLGWQSRVVHLRVPLALPVSSSRETLAVKILPLHFQHYTSHASWLMLDRMSQQLVVPSRHWRSQWHPKPLIREFQNTLVDPPIIS